MRDFLIVTFSTLILFACGDFNKVLKSKDRKLKFDRAVSYYYKKDYPRAIQLLEQLRDVYKGHDSMEIVYYYTAYSNYGVKDYDIAALYFHDYVDNFGNSPRLVECAYMEVYCQFMSIGTYELDQSNTVKTIGALQSFINHYPNSPYAEKCNNHIDILRKKLQTKQYEIVMQYYHMGDYRATVTSARNTLRSYPDLEQKEELEVLAIRAQYLYAKNSIEKKRLARYQEALDNWKEYDYINRNRGKYYQEAQTLKEKIESEIKKIKETT